MKPKLTYEDALKGAKRFSEKYVERSPYQFFPEAEVVELVQEGLHLSGSRGLGRESSRPIAPALCG